MSDTEFSEKLNTHFHLREMPDDSTTEIIGFFDDETEEPFSSKGAADKAIKTVPDFGERYSILEFLGAGGTGSVWKVHDKLLDETLAIKVLHEELLSNKKSIQRITQEARLAMELTHANIAAVFGATQDAIGRPCVIMRYVEGESLLKILAREGKLEMSRAEDIYLQIRDALAHSHAKGVVHRDIKPSNIIISQTKSGSDIVSIIDFGIAKSIYGEVQSAEAITSHGVIVGSPQYISPEQLLGQEITPASDLYSLGCVYYQMLAGHPPFTLVNPVLLVLQHINDEPDLECIPKAKRAEIGTLLQKDPKNRITTITPSKEAGFNALDFIKKDRFLLALSSAFIQLPVWINLLISYNLGPATLLLLVFLLIATPRMLQLPPQNKSQGVICQTIILNIACSAFLLLAYFLFGPNVSYQKSIGNYLAYFLAPCLIFGVVLINPWRAQISKILTSIYFQGLALLTSIAIFISVSTPLDNGVLQTPPGVKPPAASKEVLEQCLTLARTAQYDKYRLTLVSAFAPQDSTITPYRSLCKQIIESTYLTDPMIKSKTYLRLAASYSGSSPDSLKSWKNCISEALAILRTAIEKEQKPTVFFSQIRTKQQEIDFALDIAESCIEHGDYVVAEEALKLKSNNMRFESASQQQRSIKLFEKIAKGRRSQ